MFEQLSFVGQRERQLNVMNVFAGYVCELLY